MVELPDELNCTGDEPPVNTLTDVARIALSCGSLDAFRAVNFARRFPPHFHETFAIGVVESGATQIRTHRGEWIAGPGSILAFSPNEVHSADACADTGYSYRMVYPSREFMTEIGAAGILDERRPVFRQPVIDDAVLANALLRSHVPLMDGEASAEAEGQLIGALRQLVATYRANAESSTSQRSDDLAIAHRAREYMEVHFAQRVSLAAVARDLGLNAFQLIRVFGRTLGVTPYAYLVQIRINRAQQMLTHGVRVSEVAYACGFSDQAHLTRAFKKVVGVPPGQYVRRRASAA